jgi:ribosomal-protein-serine acetyltransferase
MNNVLRWEIDDHTEVRPFEAYHAEEIFGAVERNREHLRRWLPWVDLTLGVEDVQNFLAHAIEAYAEREEMHAGIFIHGKLAGTISHHHIDVMHRNVSIGYWLDATVEGKGIMTRCCAKLVQYLFDERKMHRVEIRCATGNTRSCAIPARLGFTREGVLREAEAVGGRFLDLVIWSLLEQDYPAAASRWPA